MTEARWYCVDSMGHALICSSKEDAEREADEWDAFDATTGPHRAVQLVDAAELEAANARIAELEAELVQLNELAKTAATAWDSDADHKVGKLLRAMTCKEFRAVYKPRLAKRQEGE